MAFGGSSGSGLFHWVDDSESLSGSGPVLVRVVVEAPDCHTLDLQALRACSDGAQSSGPELVQLEALHLETLPIGIPTFLVH